MNTAIFVVLASCLSFVSGQVCPTFEYGQHAFGTDCGGTPCTTGTCTGNLMCCDAGCSSGDTFCIDPDFPGCPDGTATQTPCTTSACTDSPCYQQFAPGVCTDKCLDCIAEYKDKWDNVISPADCKCAVGVTPSADCSASCGTCAADPDAECRVNRCNDPCTVHWYDKDMNGVDCNADDPCVPNPCKNGGTCTADGDDFSCECDDDYKGDECQTKKSSLSRTLLLLFFLMGQRPPQATLPPVTLPPITLPPITLPPSPCPGGRQPLPGCTQALCAGLTCPLNPVNTACRINPCGTSCTYSFVSTVTQLPVACFAAAQP